MLTGKQKGFDGDLSENMIVESVNEAGKVNSLLIDIFHKSDSCKVEKATRFGLEKWCLARNLFGQLPCPVVLIKSWAKVCEHFLVAFVSRHFSIVWLCKLPMGTQNSHEFHFGFVVWLTQKSENEGIKHSWEL